MPLDFRKVESRTTDGFKCIISQLMRETESLAKSIFDELGAVTPGEIKLILCPLHLGMVTSRSPGSVCILSSDNVQTASTG